MRVHDIFFIYLLTGILKFLSHKGPHRACFVKVLRDYSTNQRGRKQTSIIFLPFLSIKRPALNPLLSDDFSILLLYLFYLLFHKPSLPLPPQTYHAPLGGLRRPSTPLPHERRWIIPLTERAREHGEARLLTSQVLYLVGGWGESVMERLRGRAGRVERDSGGMKDLRLNGKSGSE